MLQHNLQYRLKKTNLRNSPRRFFERKPEKKKEQKFNELLVFSIRFDITINAWTPTVILHFCGTFTISYFHGTPWTHQLWDKGNKVEIILPIPSSTTHTDNKSNKVEGRKKSICVCNWGKCGIYESRTFFPLNYWQDEVVPSSSRHRHFYSHKTQLFPSQTHKFSSIPTHFVF